MLKLVLDCSEFVSKAWYGSTLAQQCITVECVFSSLCAITKFGTNILYHVLHKQPPLQEYLFMV